MGYEFWGLSLVQQNSSIKIILYIDGDKGVNINDCVKVSNQVTHLLDAENIYNSNYVLEVSSPGFDRILITYDHFLKYVGEKIRLKLKWLVKNKKNITGIIKDVKKEHVIVSDSSDIYQITYDSIESARLKV